MTMNINEYMNIINVLIIVCATNLLHFVTNEHMIKKDNNNQTEFLILGKYSFFCIF